MAISYHLGRIILCSALFLQGLYLTGVFNNTGLISSMTKGAVQLGNTIKLDSSLNKGIQQNINLIAQFIGALICTSILNVIPTSKFFIKLNILGEILYSLFVAVPWNVIRGTGSLIDPSDKSLFHLYVNVAIIGGLIYWHSTTGRKRTEH